MHIHPGTSEDIARYEHVISEHTRYCFQVLSFTEHDAFVRHEFQQNIRDKHPGLLFINGVELTAVYQNRDVHLLAYFRGHFDEHPILQLIRDGLIKKQIFLQRKARTTGEQFSNVGEIADCIHRHRGLAVLAHPIHYLKMLPELIDLVDGLECIYPLHDDALVERLFSLCRLHRLYSTAGTDFRGGFVDLARYMRQTSCYAPDLKLFIDVFGENGNGSVCRH